VKEQATLDAADEAAIEAAASGKKVNDGKETPAPGSAAGRSDHEIVEVNQPSDSGGGTDPDASSEGLR
jgi:hypothetical protein